jgi:hypothetical protein
LIAVPASLALHLSGWLMLVGGVAWPFLLWPALVCIAAGALATGLDLWRFIHGR